MKTYKIGVLGLGYVGLPVAVAVAEFFPDLIGYDINEKRISELRAHYDHTGEIDSAELKTGNVNFTNDAGDLKNCNFYIITVPTPVNDAWQPDLHPIMKATELVGKYLKKGDIVVYESTVYPGVTEEICGKLLEKQTGLISGQDFHLGYSPERINPGDKKHSLRTIVKIVSAQNKETLNSLEDVYGRVIKAGLHKAPSIKVAEAAKVIENTQRDLNIAFMNELALMFDRIGIRTKDVLDAAGTKWNFLNFTPGLVGGHCIGVDPYYLTALAEQIGYYPEVILAGRRINNSMGSYVAAKLVKLLAHGGTQITGAKVGILGLTFKENVPDLRNSKVFDVINELREYGITPLVHDAAAHPEDIAEICGLSFSPLENFTNLDALIIAVAHDHYKTLGPKHLQSMLQAGGALLDVKSIFQESDFPAVKYWSL